MCRDVPLEDWKNISEEINALIQNCVPKIEEPLREKLHYLIESSVEKQFSYALGINLP